MIAVYFNNKSSPFTLYVLDVEDDQHHKFLEKLVKSQYPFPASEVLFIENDKVINYWDPYEKV